MSTRVAHAATLGQRMSRLILVRHGQATSDLLTSLGEGQAEALARRWLAEGMSPDVAWHGRLERQRRTAEVVAETFAKAQRPFPPLRVLPGLDEYPAEAALERLGPTLAAREPGFAALRQAWLEGGPPKKANARFQRMFEPLMQAWQRGEAGHPKVEPWSAFAARVRKALKTLAQGRGVTVAAFTSGGPIGTMTQTVLEAPDSKALELNWRVRNASLTTFLFRGEQLSLDGFNDTGHLGAEMESFR